MLCSIMKRKSSTKISSPPGAALPPRNPEMRIFSVHYTTQRPSSYGKHKIIEVIPKIAVQIIKNLIKDK